MPSFMTKRCVLQNTICKSNELKGSIHVGLICSCTHSGINQSANVTFTFHVYNLYPTLQDIQPL